jgi:hypothetical protein
MPFGPYLVGRFGDHYVQCVRKMTCEVCSECWRCVFEAILQGLRVPDFTVRCVGPIHNVSLDNCMQSFWGTKNLIECA